MLKGCRNGCEATAGLSNAEMLKLCGVRKVGKWKENRK